MPLEFIENDDLDTSGRFSPSKHGEVPRAHTIETELIESMKQTPRDLPKFK